jgi:hypothetical protein
MARNLASNGIPIKPKTRRTSPFSRREITT